MAKHSSKEAALMLALSTIMNTIVSEVLAIAYSGFWDRSLLNADHDAHRITSKVYANKAQRTTKKSKSSKDFGRGPRCLISHLLFDIISDNYHLRGGIHMCTSALKGLPEIVVV